MTVGAVMTRPVQEWFGLVIILCSRRHEAMPCEGGVNSSPCHTPLRAPTLTGPSLCRHAPHCWNTWGTCCVSLAHAGAGVVGIARCQGRAKHAEFWRAYSRSKRRWAKPLFRVLNTNVNTSHFQALMCTHRPQNQLCLKFVCARFIEKSFPTRRGKSPNHREKANFFVIWLDGQWSSIQETS